MGAAEKITQMMKESSWIRKMFETGAQLKAQHGAEKVFDFSLGNPDLDPPPAFTRTLQSISAANIKGKHTYMPNAGYHEVRAAVAAYISRASGTEIGTDRVIMTCGAGGALNVILKTILNPGDKILVSTPCFVEYRFYVENHGGVLEMVPGTPDFNLDVAVLEKRIDSRTAGIIINSPNNPSGRVYPEETLQELSRMLDKKSKATGRPIYLISDEPYRHIVFDGVKVPWIFTLYKNSLVATSFSKDLSLAGERIGWLAVHPAAEDAEGLVNGAILCNRILGFVNAPALMQRCVAGLLDKHVDIGVYQRRRDRLCRGLTDMGYEVRKPEGTFYLFPRAPGGDDAAFVNLLQEELVLTVPGRGFGLPGHFRIAFCVDDNVIEGALPGFARAIEKHQSLQ
jgi:aspartate aminotransferase